MMTETNHPAPGHGLAYTGHLPLAWSELAALPSSTELTNLDYANLDVLRNILALEIQAGDPSEDPLESGSQDMARLDLKLNLLLELVGQLFAQHHMIPPAHPLTLMADGMLWQATAAPTLNSLLRIEVYCHLKYPRPLVLHGQVTEVSPQADGWSVQTLFRGLGEPVREDLERFIFIHHRRTIAYNRRRNKPSS
jgi:hypothetical protein